MSLEHRFQGFLFDLDGTLLDTAPDLLVALNLLLRKNNRRELALEDIRATVSHGSRGLIELGLGLKKDSVNFDTLKEEFLNYYQENLIENTSTFLGVEEILDKIEQSGRSWGIVTNKPSRFTMPLVEHFGWNHRAQCVICADNPKKSKPNPETLLEGARCLKLHPRECVYVGDAISDIEASRAAGMQVIIASYGYLPDKKITKAWKADSFIKTPSDLKIWLE